MGLIENCAPMIFPAPATGARLLYRDNPAFRSLRSLQTGLITFLPTGRFEISFLEVNFPRGRE